MTVLATDLQPAKPIGATTRSVRTAAVWGVVVGAIQAASPLAFW